MKRLLPILVVMAMMMVAGAVGFAIADSHGDLFYACERNGKVVGKVMVNDQPTCRRGATLVSWNSEGPAGPPGGAVQTVIRQSDDSHHYFIDDVTVEVYAYCGPNEVVTGGGHWIWGLFYDEGSNTYEGHPSFITVNKSEPVQPATEADVYGWMVEFSPVAAHGNVTLGPDFQAPDLSTDLITGVNGGAYAVCATSSNG